MARTFTAQYPGICSKCDGRINTGDPITWARRGTKGIFHAACVSPVDLSTPTPTAVPIKVGRADAPPVPPTSTTPERITAAMPDLTLTAPPATADLFPAGTPAPAPDMMAALAALMAALQPKAPAPAAPVIPAPPVAEPGPEKVTLGTISKITTRSKWWDVLEACLAAGLNRILLVGPPGTGKSTTADTDGLRVTCHEDAGPESMIGTFIQKDGNTVWVDGPTSIAMRAGKRVVSDEFDHNSPECLSLAYATLDDSPSIMLPTGEYLVAKSGYQLIGTSNSSPSDFPEAILDRFEAIIVAAEPHPNAVKIVKAQAGTKADALTGLMNNYYRGLNTTQYAFRGNPTLRKCRNFAKLLDAGLDENVAAQVVFGNAAKEILSAMTTSSAKVGE